MIGKMLLQDNSNPMILPLQDNTSPMILPSIYIVHDSTR